MAMKWFGNETSEKTLQRYFFIVKAFLMATPVIFYSYMQIKASANGCNIQDLLTREPETTIMLVNSMLNAYAAYILHLAQKNISGRNVYSAVINIGMLMLSQALSRNIFGFLLLLFVATKSIRYYKISLKDTFRQGTVKQFLYDGGGSLIIVLLNALMLYATIKLM